MNFSKDSFNRLFVIKIQNSFLHWRPFSGIFEMMNFVRKAAIGIPVMFVSCLAWGEQRDTLLLTMDELFRRGMEMSLVLQADTLDSQMAEQSLKSARMAQAPDVQVGLTGGYLGQPVVFCIATAGHSARA